MKAGEMMKTVTGFDRNKDVMMPAFSLQSAKNGKISSSRFFMKNNLVVVLIHEADDFCRQKLAELNDNYTKYRANNAEIVAVAAGNVFGLRDLADELGLDFPLVSDPDGSTIKKILDLTEPQSGLPAVFIFDRFGALQGWEASGDHPQFPDQDEIIGKLFYIETQCPECGIYP